MKIPTCGALRCAFLICRNGFTAPYGRYIVSWKSPHAAGAKPSLRTSEGLQSRSSSPFWGEGVGG
jgi:hypothetical protein